MLKLLEIKVVESQKAAEMPEKDFKIVVVAFQSSSVTIVWDAAVGDRSPAFGGPILSCNDRGATLANG